MVNTKRRRRMINMGTGVSIQRPYVSYPYLCWWTSSSLSLRFKKLCYYCCYRSAYRCCYQQCPSSTIKLMMMQIIYHYGSNASYWLDWSSESKSTTLKAPISTTTPLFAMYFMWFLIISFYFLMIYVLTLFLFLLCFSSFNNSLSSIKLFFFIFTNTQTK